MRLRYFLLPLFVVLLLTATPPIPTQARSDERCFPETGFCISGAIRSYWERNGGLAVFGYPISELRDETIEGSWRGPVQWFERDRLEDHSNEGKGVLAGRLGARILELRGTPWQGYPAAADTGNTADCRYFPVTKHRVCQPFLGYWERNGGLERFGYPITEVEGELVEGQLYMVQYFERRRLEYHPEFAGTAYEVLLGRLGWDVYQVDRWQCDRAPWEIELTARYYRSEIGCPSAGLRYGVPMSWQPFENGMMLWVQNEDVSGGQIVVMYYDRVKGGSYWHRFPDTYVEGEAVNTDVLPPPGLYVPFRGFGKLWRDNPWVRDILGFATLPEVQDSGLVQPFRDGRAAMIYRYNQDMVLVMLPPPASGDGKAYEQRPVR